MITQEPLTQPYTIEANGKKYRLTDFVTEWNIPQAGALVKVLRRGLAGATNADFDVTSLVQIVGQLVEEDLIQEALAILFLPEGQKRFDKKTYRDNIPDMEELTPVDAINAFKRFFTSTDWQRLGIGLTFSQAANPAEDSQKQTSDSLGTTEQN